MNDKYSKALERALFNWYYSGENAHSEPVFNMLREGYDNGMQIFVPIELPEEFLKQVANNRASSGSAEFSIDKDIPISFCHIPVDDEGHYLIPVFTSEEQMNIGQSMPAVNQTLKGVLDAMDSWPDCAGIVIDMYGNKMLIDRNVRAIIMDYKPKSHLSFIKGGVLDIKASAVVNSAHKTLLSGKAVDDIIISDFAEGEEIDDAFLCGGGLTGAIHQAAGEELFRECSTLGGCAQGDAKITGAYGIDGADHIIHTVGPFYMGEDTLEQDSRTLVSCYRNALDLAAENGCESVAFPCISAGANRFPAGRSAQIAVVTVIEWFEEHPDKLMNVYLCCFTDNEYKNYLTMIKQ